MKTEINIKKLTEEVEILKGQVKLLTKRLELYRSENEEKLQATKDMIKQASKSNPNLPIKYKTDIPIPEFNINRKDFELKVKQINSKEK